MGKDMEKKKLESMLIDYIDNKLDAADRAQVEQEIVSNSDAHRLYEELKEVMHLMDRSAQLEPASRVGENFENFLKDEIAASGSSKLIVFHPNFYRAAAAVALLVIGGGVGFWLNERHDERIANLEAEMKMQRELMETTRSMMAMIDNDQSASKRIQGVNVAMTISKADDEIVNALTKLMNEDPNSNVRLAALEALSKFINEPGVRKQIVSSLPNQKDPVVQIALIQLLVKMKETGVVDDLQKIVDDEGTMQAVKDEAYSGILKLS